MSTAEASRFYDDLKTKPELRQAVQSVQDSMVALSKSHGYDFSHAELLQHLAETWGADYEKDNPYPDDPQTCACI